MRKVKLVADTSFKIAGYELWNCHEVIVRRMRRAKGSSDVEALHRDKNVCTRQPSESFLCLRRPRKVQELPKEPKKLKKSHTKEKYVLGSGLVLAYWLYNRVTHFIGNYTKKYYVEDFVRVYPDGSAFCPLAIKIPRKATDEDIKNFLNHSKAYKFASQFVKRKKVADIGCGSGYGCEILKKAGALHVCGSDISDDSIRFAKSRYDAFAEFSVQNITSLNEYPDNFFDVVISSEVLEHVKEYKMEQKAIDELKRVTRRGGLLIIGTPNTENAGTHGFSFDEIERLLKKKFSQFIIFENAVVPFGDAKLLWDKRIEDGKTGTVVSENVDLSETFIPYNVDPKLKQGIKPGRIRFGSYVVDTHLLHNTYSWMILAIK